MDLRLAVGGLLTRNAVLSTLLLNYADRIVQASPGPGAASAPCFIVPSWSADQCARPGCQLLTVEAHTCRTDPRRRENLDAVLWLLQEVLTGDEAVASITARLLGTSDDLVPGDRDTVVRVGTWEIAPASSATARSHSLAPAARAGSRARAR
ncbi:MULTISPECIES: hypothetical protein [unclassified Geodermatophilus]|uniref:hypothetical protein n=1 Tax=unclassified Geodermatophilus TaxID=2637632 RepID=UPI003EE86211